MTTRASSCGCSSTTTPGATGGMTGRTTTLPRRNFWPGHDLSYPTDFINARNRTALMWRL